MNNTKQNYPSAVEILERYRRLSTTEQGWVRDCFVLRHYPKHTQLLKPGQTCRYIYYVSSGGIRHFFLHEAGEKTCDLTLSGEWCTELTSFTKQLPAQIGLETSMDTVVLAVSSQSLRKLYRLSSTFETIGRSITEQVLERTLNHSVAVSGLSPAEHYSYLLEQQPEVVRHLPQKHLASLIGVSPESLSRIKKRLHAQRRT